MYKKLLCTALATEMFTDVLASVATHGSRSIAIALESKNRVMNAAYIFGADADAGIGLPHDLLGFAAASDDDGLGAGHRFKEFSRKRAPEEVQLAQRDDRTVGRIEETRNAVFRERINELDVVEPAFAGGAPEPFLPGAIADQYELNVTIAFLMEQSGSLHNRSDMVEMAKRAGI